MVNLMLLAKQNNALAQFNLAELYGYGGIIRKKPIEAKEWYKKSAQMVLLSLNTNWLGFKPPFETIKKLFIGIKSRRTRVDHCSIKLGVMYHFGEGVKQDFELAKYWYQKAAEQGDKKAQKITR